MEYVISIEVKSTPGSCQSYIEYLIAKTLEKEGIEIDKFEHDHWKNLNELKKFQKTNTYAKMFVQSNVKVNIIDKIISHKEN